MRYALIAAIFMESTAQAAEPAPRFAAFPVVGLYQGRNALPILDSEYARTYRTRIRDAARAMRPNFAGEYILLTWGCGTSCEQITIINARTGQVIHPPISAIGGEAIFDIEKSDSYERVVSNVNSRLLLVKGKTAEDQEFDGYRYYTFDGQNLTHLRTIIVKPREEQPTSSTAEATPAPPPAKAALPDECKWSKASRMDQAIKCPNDGAPPVYIKNRIAMQGYPAVDIDPKTGQPSRNRSRTEIQSAVYGRTRIMPASFLPSILNYDYRDECFRQADKYHDIEHVDACLSAEEDGLRSLAGTWQKLSQQQQSDCVRMITDAELRDPGRGKAVNIMAVAGCARGFLMP